MTIHALVHTDPYKTQTQHQSVEKQPQGGARGFEMNKARHVAKTGALLVHSKGMVTICCHKCAIYFFLNFGVFFTFCLTLEKAYFTFPLPKHSMKTCSQCGFLTTCPGPTISDVPFPLLRPANSNMDACLAHVAIVYFNLSVQGRGSRTRANRTSFPSSGAPGHRCRSHEPQTCQPIPMKNVDCRSRPGWCLQREFDEFLARMSQTKSQDVSSKTTGHWDKGTALWNCSRVQLEHVSLLAVLTTLPSLSKTTYEGFKPVWRAMPLFDAHQRCAKCSVCLSERRKKCGA